jgi:hypothetical protein
MNRKLYNAFGVIWGSLLVLALSPGALAQEGSYEEKLVRSVYAKLTVYNRAAVSERAAEAKTPVDPEAIVQFELRDFETGPVEKILDMPFGRFVTVPVGEIIQIIKGTTQLPNGPKHITYKARWEEAPGIMEDWSSMPVSHILSGDEQVRANVRKYTSYEVRVRLKGREKIYRATAFFLEPLQTVTNSKPMIFDLILGIEEMTDLVEEKRMPLISPWEQYVKTPLFHKYKMAVEKGSDFTPQFVECPPGYDYMTGGSDYLWEGWCCDGGRMRCCLPDAFAGEISCCAQLFSMRGDQMEKNLSYCGYDPVPPIEPIGGDPVEPGGCVDRRITFDVQEDTTGDLDEDHFWGYHKAWARFQGYCQYNSDCTVNCKMDEYGFEAIGERESGLRKVYMLHKPAIATAHQPMNGVQIPPGGPQSPATIICGRAFAVAWKFCPTLICGVKIKVEWNGSGFTAETEEDRKWEFMPTQSCLLQPPVTN